MPFHLSFERIKKRDGSPKGVDSRNIILVNRIWILGILGVILYFAE